MLTIIILETASVNKGPGASLEGEVERIPHGLGGNKILVFTRAKVIETA